MPWARAQATSSGESPTISVSAGVKRRPTALRRAPPAHRRQLVALDGVVAVRRRAEVAGEPAAAELDLRAPLPVAGEQAERARRSGGERLQPLDHRRQQAHRAPVRAPLRAHRRRRRASVEPGQHLLAPSRAGHQVEHDARVGLARELVARQVAGGPVDRLQRGGEGRAALAAAVDQRAVDVEQDELHRRLRSLPPPRRGLRGEEGRDAVPAVRASARAAAFASAARSRRSSSGRPRTSSSSRLVRAIDSTRPGRGSPRPSAPLRRRARRAARRG